MLLDPWVAALSVTTAVIAYYVCPSRRDSKCSLAVMLVAYVMMVAVVNKLTRRLEDSQRIIEAQSQKLSKLTESGHHQDSGLLLQESRREQIIKELAKSYLTSTLKNPKEEH